MRPFIGYHAADYFRHWLSIGKRSGAKLPKIFHVNWFRQDDNGKFLWPGFGDNMRVLEWILGRVAGTSTAVESALGLMPKAKDINISGLSLTEAQLESLLSVNRQEWMRELGSQEDFLNSIGTKLPKEILAEHESLRERLSAASVAAASLSTAAVI
jgi:phosphoenolpyruvate carboxykinase (GTP)